MNPVSDTTPAAGAAGAAFGGLVGLGLASVTGLTPELVIPPCGVIGAFAFGRLFPR